HGPPSSHRATGVLLESWQASSRLRSVSVHIRDVYRLHGVADDQLADFAPHVLPDSGREPVVESGPDANQRYLVGIGPEIGPAESSAWRRGTRANRFPQLA